MRTTEQRMGGLSVEEQAAIDALMAPYRREWGDSPVLRRYGRVPNLDAPAVAQKVFELAGGKLWPLHTGRPAARHQTGASRRKYGAMIAQQLVNDIQAIDMPAIELAQDHRRRSGMA